MKLLTEAAVKVCLHENGLVSAIASQNLVRVAGLRVQVEPDPEGRPIAGCPNVGPTIKPCTSTLKVQSGYSGFLRIQGRRVCLDSVVGLTDGTPPGTVQYKVRTPGQNFVSANA